MTVPIAVRYPDPGERAAAAAHTAYYGGNTGVRPYPTTSAAGRRRWRAFAAAVSARGAGPGDSRRIDAGRAAMRSPGRHVTPYTDITANNQARWLRALRAVDAVTR